ncbi:MAG TPA: hypothetical protein VNN09_13730 [Candidatus Competibacteraceae bacterium]|nr:hypothetical protein [Candidatus Competibacteraceae bacterium]
MSTNDKPHFTTRRGFIAASGFGVVALYGLWAAYGAAPLGFIGADEQQAEATAGGHGGHGGATAGPDAEEFKRLTEAFVAANQLPDGSVQPRRMATAAPAMADEHAGHGMPAAPMPEEHAEGPIDVYLMAFRFGYKPAVLKLEAGVPYRFRMMAVDTTHGASINLGEASRMLRLRPNTLVEQEVTFTRPGQYLLYCTVYCGLAHDLMQGKIIVTAAQTGSVSHETARSH